MPSEVVKIRKVAGSLVISLPKSILDDSDLEEGDKVRVYSGNRSVLVDLHERKTGRKNGKLSRKPVG